MRIYLAGRCGGPKWDLVKRLGERGKRIEFVASDEELHDNHGMGTPDAAAHMFSEEIHHCDQLIAYLSTPHAYGTVAEIAYAAALKIPTFVILKIPPTPSTETYEEYMETLNYQMRDSYAFVGALDGVVEFEVEDDEAAQAIFDNLSLIESPIERRFWLAARQSPIFGNLTAQVEIGKYRVDFFYAGNGKKIAVELDGHDYHKTREQRTYDAERDRHLRMQGVEVVRFTGSEIHKNAHNCICDLLEIIGYQPTHQMTYRNPYLYRLPTDEAEEGAEGIF